MPIERRAETAAPGEVIAASFTSVIPAAAQPGDLLLCFVSNSNGTFGIPAGWTVFLTLDFGRAVRRIYQAGDANPVFTGLAGTSWNGMMIDYMGNRASPFLSATGQDRRNDTFCRLPAISLPMSNLLVVYMHVVLAGTFRTWADVHVDNRRNWTHPLGGLNAGCCIADSPNSYLGPPGAMLRSFQVHPNHDSNIEAIKDNMGAHAAFMSADSAMVGGHLKKMRMGLSLTSGRRRRPGEPIAIEAGPGGGGVQIFERTTPAPPTPSPPSKGRGRRGKP